MDSTLYIDVLLRDGHSRSSFAREQRWAPSTIRCSRSRPCEHATSTFSASSSSVTKIPKPSKRSPNSAARKARTIARLSPLTRSPCTPPSTPPSILTISIMKRETHRRSGTRSRNTHCSARWSKFVRGEGAYLLHHDSHPPHRCDRLLVGRDARSLPPSHCHAIQKQAEQLNQIIFAGHTHEPAEEVASAMLKLARAVSTTCSFPTAARPASRWP